MRSRSPIPPTGKQSLDFRNLAIPPVDAIIVRPPPPPRITPAFVLFVPLPRFARSLQGVYPFLRHSRLIYIPGSLVFDWRVHLRPACFRSSLCSFASVPAAIVVRGARGGATCSRWRYYGERERLLRRLHPRQRATTSVPSRKPFIKFLITEI